jgi:hypothetical protein
MTRKCTCNYIWDPTCTEKVEVRVTNSRCALHGKRGHLQIVTDLDEMIEDSPADNDIVLPK